MILPQLIMNKENTKALGQDVNEVVLQGVIVHKFVTPAIAILTINTGNSTPVPNYPKILFFGDLREKVEKEFEVKDHVTIVGNIQSSKRKENVKNQVMQSIFAESITATPSVMEKAFGIDEVKNSYKAFSNSFKIAGQVMSIESPAANMVRMVVKTYKNNHISFVKLVHFSKNFAEILSEIHPQDYVCGVGCVQTSKNETEKGTVYYEDYVLLEINKMDK